jgi:hypothetical protein
MVLVHRYLRLSLIVLVLLIIPAFQVQTSAARPAKQVYVYYFGWHTGQSWQDGRLTDQPITRYDSRERWAIEHHINLALGAGIDAFVMSWFGRKGDNITAPAFETLLSVAAQKGFKAAASVDMSQDNFNATVDEVVESLRYLLNEKVHQPGYLRYDGKPLIYFWNQDRFTAAQWRDMRNALDPKHTSIWVMEGTNTSLLGIFDGLYLFNTAWSNNPAGTAAGWAGRTYGAGGKFFTPTVMPGWDESRIGGRTNPTPPQDRAGGAFLAKSWAGATEAGTSAILIVSWNEYLENSYIEPSERYGSTALNVLRPLIAAWKAGRPVPQLKFDAPTAPTAQPNANAPQAPTNEWRGKSLTPTVKLLTVRAGPGTNYGQIGTINAGEVYPVQDKQNDWFQIDYKGQKGYVFAAMVRVQ